MTITINLPADVAARLADKAAREGQTMADMMQQLAMWEAGVEQAQALADWDALLDSFDEGDLQDHQDTIATLARG